MPRLAVGTFQPGANPQIALWALMEALRQSGVQSQCFLSRACFPPDLGAASVTGLCVRHLDSWLMSPATCREIFLRGAHPADLALVEGRFEQATGDGPGGRLEPLCQWLDLPRVAVVDVSRLGACRLPVPPAGLDGLLLDCTAGGEQAARWATDLETLWGVPVLGSMELSPRTRAQIETAAQGDRLPRELCEVLGGRLARHWRPERIMALAARRPLPGACFRTSGACLKRRRLTVAIAYDEAFNCYFPDTLDQLEHRGASVVDFSPLRDESLPPAADIVYLGCGHPERHAAALAENHCMAAALRSHLCADRRIYAEGGGAAYLCQQMDLPDGRSWRMAGILPAIARLASKPAPAAPIEVTLARSNWLGEKGTRLRGYRNGAWRFEAAGKLSSLTAEDQHRYALAGSFQAVGSLLHLNFAAQPGRLDHFFSPERSEGEPLPWTVPMGR